MSDQDLVIKLMEQGFSSMEHRFEGVDKRFDSLEKTANAQIVQLRDAHKTQINRCNDLHGGLDERVDGLAERMALYNGHEKEKKKQGEIDYWFWAKIVGIFAAASFVMSVVHVYLAHFVKG